MKINPKIAAAVASILGAPTPVIVFAADVSSAGTGNELQEVIVTAQRREENLQNVPISIQALTADMLQQLGTPTFDDFVRYLPNVTQASWGPGQSLIFMRGLSSGALGTQGSGTDANFPNVAVYLDEQSAQMPYRNLDIYAADISRIEVLAGPQGTLFGAGAEAGAIRYITNKPVLDVTSGEVNAGYGSTAHGDPNSFGNATLNLPLIAGTLAIRGVIYVDSRGGYIDNVPGTFTRRYSDLGIAGPGGAFASASGCAIPGTTNIYPSCQNVINNNSTVANNINPVTYQGIRVELLYKINDKWDFLVSQSYQNMNAQGVFYQEPASTDGAPLPDLSVTTYNPSYTKDKFENTAWTLNGEIGDISMIYTGGYLVRNVEAQQDYTAYSRGNYADYYQCTSNADGPQTPAPHPLCYSPSAYWRNTQRLTHQSHELRFHTPYEWRLRGLLGGFWEDFNLEDNSDWFYKSLPACQDAAQTGCMTNIQPAPGSTQNIPGTRPDNESFLDDTQRGYKQYAFFGSLDFDLIPNTLTLTAGTRWYHFSNTETGSNVFSFGCYDGGAPPCANEDANNIDALNLKSTYSGFKSRANLTWHIDSDVMVYYTWSQGFRPGGFNRSSSGPHLVPPNSPAGTEGTYFTPQAFSPDSLTNNEIGWKTMWFNRRLLVNGAIYQEDWKNVQQQFFDPSATGNLSFVTNGGDYRVRGLELQATGRVTDGLTIEGSAAWNSSELTNSPYLIGNNPTGPLYGQPLTFAPNPFGNKGDSLPQSPPLQANARVRYEWSTSAGYHPFAQAGFVYTAHSRSLPGNVPAIAPSGDVTTQAFDQPAYTTYDASLGVSKDNWTVQVIGQNLTDTRGKVFISSSEAIETQTVIRPRVIMLQASWNFGK
jgi:outer membrane receptor protein involved in Fe transport